MSEINLEQLDEERLENAFQRILNTKEDALVAELDRKEYEKNIKERLAMKKSFYKKDGSTPDASKIKIATFKKAMVVHLDDGPNKVAEELSLLEEYIHDMKSDEEIYGLANSLASKMLNEKDKKESIKDLKDELLEEFDKEIVEALMYIANNRIEERKEAMTASDDKPAKSKNSMEEILSIVRKIREKIGI